MQRVLPDLACGGRPGRNESALACDRKRRRPSNVLGKCLLDCRETHLTSFDSISRVGLEAIKTGRGTGPTTPGQPLRSESGV